MPCTDNSKISTQQAAANVSVSANKPDYLQSAEGDRYPG